jgi:hypothetical protein
MSYSPKTIAVDGSCRYDFWVIRDKSTTRGRPTYCLSRRPGAWPQTTRPRIGPFGSSRKDRRRLTNEKLGSSCITVGILVCALLSGCAHYVKVSYAPAAVIHTAFDQPTTDWEGERVQVVLTPSLKGESCLYKKEKNKIIFC